MTNVAKTGLRKVQAGLSERITELEKGVIQFLNGVNQRFQGTDNRLAVLEERVNALVELTGKEDVDLYITNKRIEASRAQAELEKASLEEAIKDGFVFTDEKVGPRSLLVGRYIDKDGGIEEPARVQLVVPNVLEAFRSQLLDQAVGFQMDIGVGRKFEITEIYRVDDEIAKTVMENKRKAQAEAAAQAAAKAASDDEKKDTAAPAAADTAAAPTPAAEAQPAQENQ